MGGARAADRPLLITLLGKGMAMAKKQGDEQCTCTTGSGCRSCMTLTTFANTVHLEVCTKRTLLR